MFYERNGSLKFCSAGSCKGPEKNFRGGPTLTFFGFLVAEGREDPNTTISGLLLARQLNAIFMAFCWRADDGLTMNVGLVAL